MKKRTYLRLMLNEEPTGQTNEIDEISKILSARGVDFTRETEKHPKGGASFLSFGQMTNSKTSQNS